MKSRRHRAIAKAQWQTLVKQMNFAGYAVTLHGAKHLTWKQESLIMDVVLLANDYERLRRFVK